MYGYSLSHDYILLNTKLNSYKIINIIHIMFYVNIIIYIYHIVLKKYKYSTNISI